MEGTYFFGDHLRWNLGWENPNPAGAFVAMWIPLLWSLAKSGQKEARRASLWSWFVLGVELGLWFLLCKTYSRGALVALGVAGLIYFLWGWWKEGRKAAWMQGGVRILGVAALLVTTGFLDRIEPSYVATDASAGNRLTLWKGGLEMIAVEPWTGWGRGESGPGYMHWFQPVEESEAYAGMVNSYLHVGVERGLPFLVGVLGVTLMMVGLAFVSASDRELRNRKANVAHLLGGLGASLLVFLGVNFFSTLWIFENLWCLPLASVLLIFGGSWRLRAQVFLPLLAKVIACSIVVAIFLGVLIYGISRSIDNELKIERKGEAVLVLSRKEQDKNVRRILMFPDRSTLGESWGKEIRRLIEDEHFRDVEVVVATEAVPRGGEGFELIVASGSRYQEGLKAATNHPASPLILVHPKGKPFVIDEVENEVTLVLPFVDTDGAGRIWRREGRKQKWKVRVNAGVGQDVRLVWPQVIYEADGLY
ncbi:MAG: O-antigen ligase family protein [Verrucomicrobiota bacterium JB023]|nr:O-antigen ligase family protein [Verrucomicrobiota bacterium JB023]